MIELQDTIKNFLKEITKDLKFECPHEDNNSEPVFSAPAIFGAYLPTKKRGEADQVPCILIKPFKGSDAAESSSAKVELMVITYSKDLEGYRDLMIIMNRIRQHALKKAIVGKYAIAFPFDWEIPQDQSYPYWHMSITTNWEVPRPIPELDPEIFGSETCVNL